MTEFWHWWVVLIVVVNIVGCWLLLRFTRDIRETENSKTTGHVYDGIEEYDNPLPRWWLNLFYITLIFSVAYLIFYPGLGYYKGVLNWSQESQHAQEVETTRKVYQPLFDQYMTIPVAKLAKNQQAIKMGKRIFVNTCFGCHGSDARGNPGYPNLTDNDWLWGGEPAQIKQSILTGRKGVMPAFGQSLTAAQINSLVHYVGQLSGNHVDKKQALAGKTIFESQCFVCHGKDGKGNIQMGAPNLTDNTWLYRGSRVDIAKTIREGRQGEMPEHASILGDARAHIVAAYIYSLSN